MSTAASLRPGKVRFISAMRDDDEVPLEELLTIEQIAQELARTAPLGCRSARTQSAG